MRRGDGSLYDITVPGYKANLSDVLAAIALVQLDKLPEHTAAPASASSRSTTTGLAGARRDRAARARPARHARAPPLRRPRRRRALRADARRAAAGARARSGSRPRSTSCPCTGSPGTASASPSQPPLPVAERAGDEILSLPLSPAHSDDDIADVLEALQPDPRPRRMKRLLRVLATLAAHGPRGRLPRLEGRPRRDGRRARATRARGGSLLAVAIMIADASCRWRSRWQWLLASQGMRERLPLADAGLLRRPTRPARSCRPRSAATRCGSSRRRGGIRARLGAIYARSSCSSAALGGAATVLLGAVGFVLAIGRYDVGAYLWLEGAFVLGTIVLAFLFFSRSARPLLRRSAPLLARLRLERPVRAVYEGVHVFRDHTGLLVGVVRAHGRHPGGSRARDLGDGARGRDRPLAADLLRDGPALLPRPARPVHAQRLRGARGVLRQLPRQRRRRRRTRPSPPASSSSSSRSRWRCRAARSCSGRGCAAGPSADPCLTRASSSSPTTRCRGSSSASRASAARRRSSSTTARRDGTVDVVRELFPEAQRDRAGEPRPRRRLERGHGGRLGPLLPDPERRRLADRGLARAARRVRRRASGGGGRRAAAARIPTGRCSARCAASRRSGGSRPSTSSCASSRRARGC